MRPVSVGTKNGQVMIDRMEMDVDRTDRTSRRGPRVPIIVEVRYTFNVVYIPRNKDMDLDIEGLCKALLKTEYSDPLQLQMAITRMLQEED